MFQEEYDQNTLRAQKRDKSHLDRRIREEFIRWAHLKSTSVGKHEGSARDEQRKREKKVQTVRRKQKIVWFG